MTDFQRAGLLIGTILRQTAAVEFEAALQRSQRAPEMLFCFHRPWTSTMGRNFRRLVGFPLRDHLRHRKQASARSLLPCRQR